MLHLVSLYPLARCGSKATPPRTAGTTGAPAPAGLPILFDFWTAAYQAIEDSLPELPHFLPEAAGWSLPMPRVFGPTPRTPASIRPAAVAAGDAAAIS
jgi:hypothetical protein